MKIQEQTRKETRLETLQRKITGTGYIKSYPVLEHLKELHGVRHIEIKFIELVLNYQDNNQPFKMKYQSIADILNISLQNVKDRVTHLKKLKIFKTDNKKNFNGTAGGSSTGLSVDLDVILEMLSGVEPITSKQTTTPKVVESQSEPATETVKEKQEEPVQKPEPITPIAQETPTEPKENSEVTELMQYLNDTFQFKESYHLKLITQSIKDGKVKTKEDIDEKIKPLNYVRK